MTAGKVSLYPAEAVVDDAVMVVVDVIVVALLVRVLLSLWVASASANTNPQTSRMIKSIATTSLGFISLSLFSHVI